MAKSIFAQIPPSMHLTLLGFDKTDISQEHRILGKVMAADRELIPGKQEREQT